MRLKSEIWVKAYVRRVNGLGVPAMVVARGHEDAGAIYLKVALLDGRAALFGPAPAGMAEVASERLWVRLHKAEAIAEREADQQLERAREIDPDLWLIEVEDRAGRHFLESWLAPQ
jgi:hypothetical protein